MKFVFSLLEAHVCLSQITFKTSLGDDLRVSSAPLVVPVRLSRQGLSEVVNHLLNLPKVRAIHVILVHVNSPSGDDAQNPGPCVNTIHQVSYLKNLVMKA
jgi:hypothetical protein